MASPDSAKLGNTTTDLVAALSKGGAGMVPVVGSLVAEVVGYVIPNQRVDRIARFVHLLEERVGKLEEAALKAKFSQPAIVDLLEDAFTQAARATSQERLEHIANVVANGISADELNQAEAKRMLWLLGQLNDAEIIILRSKLAQTSDEFAKDAEFRQKHDQLLASDTTHMGSTDDEFEEAALKGSYRQHLHDLDLIRHRFKQPRRGELPEFDDKTGMMKASGSQVTRLGKMLLHYLNLIPAWHTR